MKNTLLSLDETIHNRLNPVDLQDAAWRSSVHQTAFWADVFAGASALRQVILTESLNARSRKQLAVFIQSSQAGCIHLADTLSYYLKILVKNDTNKYPSKHLIEYYTTLIGRLLDTLKFLENNFSWCFDASMMLPLALKEPSQKYITERLNRIKPLLVKQCTNHPLLTILFQPFEELAAGENIIFSYSNLFYFKNLMLMIEKLISQKNTADSSVQLQAILFRHNFNHPSFVQYLFDHFNAEINIQQTPSRKLQAWRVNFNQVALQKSTEQEGLYPHLPSLTRTLKTMMKDEIAYIVKNEILLYNSSAGGHAQKPVGIKTGLSVAQLAVFIRLLLEEEIIITDNHAKIFRSIAAVFQTPRTSGISPESLRNKYHTPEAAALKITKDYLIQMVNRLRNY